MKWEPLNKFNYNFLLQCYEAEQRTEQMPEKLRKDLDTELLTQTLQYLIQSHKFPIEFSDWALLSIFAYCTTTAHVFILLMDCLDVYQNEIITVKKLRDLYSQGFYSIEAFKYELENIQKRKWYFSNTM